MRLRVPEYYNQFQCIADRCQDSCCVGWEIDIDEDSYDYYQSIEGEFGERLRKNIKQGNDNCFRLKKGRCPFLNQENLCDICIELGEEALCEVCTEYPRFTMEYGDVMEKCMALSCEEVGRLVFESREPFRYIELEQAEVASWQDEEPPFIYIEAIETTREAIFHLLRNRKRTIAERICDCLMYAEKVQERINQEKYEEIVQDGKTVLHGKYDFYHRDQTKNTRKCYELCKFRLVRYKELEVLDEEWKLGLSHVEKVVAEALNEASYEEEMEQFLDSIKHREYEYEKLLSYYVYRYFMRAVYDYDVLGKLKLSVLSYLCIRDFDLVRYIEKGHQYDLADRIDLARIYSKEVEHSEDNIADLFEMFEFDDELSVENLMFVL